MLFHCSCAQPCCPCWAQLNLALIGAINYTWCLLPLLSRLTHLFPLNFVFFLKSYRVCVSDRLHETGCSHVSSHPRRPSAAFSPSQLLQCFIRYSVLTYLKQCQQLSFSPPAAVSCGVPSAPVNGGVLATDYSVGTRVTYFCNSGYRLSSKELTTTVCQPDGTWSNHNKIPRCSGEKLMRRGGGGWPTRSRRQSDLGKLFSITVGSSEGKMLTRKSPILLF